MKRELFIFVMSMAAGGGIGLFFDFFRAARKEIPHKKWCIAIEDLFFWMTAGCFLFGLLEKWNYGILRFYVFLGNGIGFLIYKNTVQNLIFCVLAWIFHQLAWIGRKMIKVGAGSRKIFKKLIYFPLKCIIKKFKIILYNI